MKGEFVIFDLDNCISNDRWRVKRIDPFKTGEAKYADYHCLSPFDEFGWKNEFLLLKAIREEQTIIISTGRCDRYRASTSYWLEKYRVPAKLIFMRPKGNNDSAVDLKQDVLEQLSSHCGINNKNIVAAYDDRQDVIDMYKSNGINAERHFLHDRPQID